MVGETTRVENRGERLGGKRLGEKRLGGETSCYHPHDGRADKNPYPHNRRADKDSYPHDSNNQCIILRLQVLGHIWAFAMINVQLMLV